MARTSAAFRAIGRRIQELRKGLGLTQAQLADRVNLTMNYVGRVERGEAQPTVEALLALAAALKANPSDLFTYVDAPLPRGEIKQRIKELLDRL